MARPSSLALSFEPTSTKFSEVLVQSEAEDLVEVEEATVAPRVVLGDELLDGEEADDVAEPDLEVPLTSLSSFFANRNATASFDSSSETLTFDKASHSFARDLKTPSSKNTRQICIEKEHK